MKLYNSFVMEAKRALAELGMDDIIFSQNEEDGQITIETGAYLVEPGPGVIGYSVTTDPKVGCRCHGCYMCEQGGRV